MQQKDERTRFVHWILLLLFASFAGFNYADFDIRWIQLVEDRFEFLLLIYDFVFSCPEVPFVLSSK